MVIIEDLRCLGKADVMLLLVVPSLLGIPFEYQHRASNSNLTRMYKKAEIGDFSRRREIGANDHVGFDDAGRIDCRALHEEIADQLIVDVRFN